MNSEQPNEPSKQLSLWEEFVEKSQNIQRDDSARAPIEKSALDDNHALMEPSSEGTMQGGPLSPLLSNIYLDDLDKELDSRGLPFVRYADDFVIFTKTEVAAGRVYASVEIPNVSATFLVRVRTSAVRRKKK